MSSTSVTVVVPREGGTEDRGVLDAVARYMETTGFTFEIISAEGDSFGASLRRAVVDAAGKVVVLVDPAMPYPVGAIGDAVALVESGTAEIARAVSTRGPFGSPLMRSFLVHDLPDPAIFLVALSSSAAKTIVGETRLTGRSCELEMAFLANKYGFRTESIDVRPSAGSRDRSLGAMGGVTSAIRIRLANRRNVYRPARRCPVCFSAEVYSCGQIPGNVVRACRRCKCRYLNQFADLEGSQPVRRVIRAHRAVAQPSYESHSAPARERTSLRRLNWVRRQLPPKARVLEVGVRDGSFGVAAATEYEYVGIDPASAAARHARARGLEVYCASLGMFVNTGPAFDAITLFHVFENMPDPHDALGRIKDLLKPGGVLFLSALDTEGILYLLSGSRMMAQNFRTHLILYSRSALIELLEHSGFEIIDIGPDFEYRDQKFLRHWLASHHPMVAPLARLMLRLLPDPTIVSTGSIRIIARRRSGTPLNVRAIRSAEPTHAR